MKQCGQCNLLHPNLKKSHKRRLSLWSTRAPFQGMFSLPLSLSPKLQMPFFCLFNLFPETISSTAHFSLCDFLNKLSFIVWKKTFSLQNNLKNKKSKENRKNIWVRTVNPLLTNFLQVSYPSFIICTMVIILVPTLWDCENEMNLNV